MPHLTLEYSRNLISLDVPSALTRASEAMFDSGLFNEPDIKCRAHCCEVFRIGVRPMPRSFIHVHIAMMPGRSEEERKELADAVLAAVSAGLKLPTGMECQLSVETVELVASSYAKLSMRGGA